MTVQARKPAGAPTGGQFATASRSEPAVALHTAPPADLPDELSTPQAESLFDAIWEGRATGFSETRLREQLEENTRLLQGLREGTIPPRRIIGTGYKKGRARPLAEEWLTAQVRAGETALATRGRSDAVNQSNVRTRLRASSRAGAGEQGPEASEPTEEDDQRTCARCGDAVDYLSSRDWCDGCEATP